MPDTTDGNAGIGTERDTEVAARPQKRSFRIDGHNTSISLETAFWDAFRDLASARGQPMSGLLAEIDRDRGAAGLSSAVRVFLLRSAQSGKLAAIAPADVAATDQAVSHSDDAA